MKALGTIANTVVAVAQTAVQVLKQALDFVGLFIRQMVHQFIDPLLSGLTESIAQTRLSVEGTYPSARQQYQATGTVDSTTVQRLVTVLMGRNVWILLGLSAVVIAIGIALYPIAPIGLAIMTVAGAIAGALLFKAIAGAEFALPTRSPQIGLLNPFRSNTAFDIALNYANEVSPRASTVEERRRDSALASIMFGAFSGFIGLAAISAADPTGTTIALAGVVISAVGALLAGAAVLPGASGLGIIALGFAVAGLAAGVWGLAAAYIAWNSGAVFAGWISFDLALGSIAFAIIAL